MAQTCPLPSRLSQREYSALSYYLQRPGVVNPGDRRVVKKLADYRVMDIESKLSEQGALEYARVNLLGIRVLRKEEARRIKRERMANY